MDFGELNLYLLYILSHFHLTTALTDAASCSKSSSSAGEFEGDSWDRHLLALNKFFFCTLFLWPLKESLSFAFEEASIKWPGSEIAVHPPWQN